MYIVGHISAEGIHQRKWVWPSTDSSDRAHSAFQVWCCSDLVDTGRLCLHPPTPTEASFKVASFPGLTRPRKKGLFIHCLRMRVIIYAKKDEEEHMMFPIHVLDDVMYCTRTKPGLELYTSLIRCQLFKAYNPRWTVSFLYGTVSFHNTLTYQIRLVAI